MNRRIRCDRCRRRWDNRWDSRRSWTRRRVGGGVEGTGRVGGGGQSARSRVGQGIGGGTGDAERALTVRAGRARGGFLDAEDEEAELKGAASRDELLDAKLPTKFSTPRFRATVTRLPRHSVVARTYSLSHHALVITYRSNLARSFAARSSSLVRAALAGAQPSRSHIAAFARASRPRPASPSWTRTVKKCVSRVDVALSFARVRLDARFPRAQVARFKV